MGSWLQELLKLMAGAAVGITVYTIVADNINIAGRDAKQGTEQAGEVMKSGK